MPQEAQHLGELDIRQYPLIRRCDDMTRSQDFLAMGIVSPMLTPTLYDCNLHNLDDLIRIGNLGFKRQCNDYLIRTYDLRHRFQHIIYGHRKRLTFNISVAGGGN